VVGTVADPIKRTILEVSVGRATVPASERSNSGCGFARDRTPISCSGSVWLRRESGIVLNNDETAGSVRLQWGERLFLGMYQLGMNVFFPPTLLALSPFLLLKRKRRATLFPRLGFQPFPKTIRPEGGTVRGREKVLWAHALSVGEVRSAVPLIRELYPRIKPAKLYLSVSTLSGSETARDKLEGSLDGLFYFPLDLLFAVRRCFARLEPSLVVLVETDIWPGFMAELRRRGLPSFLINARLSRTSFKRYRHAKRLFSPALNTFSRIYPQSPSDAEAFKSMGVNTEKVADPGNLKFDAARTSTRPDQLGQLRAKLAIREGDKILVAGSTHEGEEVILRRTFLQLRQSIPRLKMIVAPRHPHRADEVRQVFLRDPVQVALYSSLPRDRFDVVVVDEFGVLSSLYQFGDLAYVGGSLVPKGGQNPVEPAAAGSPVLFGPDMSDFPDIAELMLKEGGAMQVKDGDELTAQAYRLLADQDLRARLGAKNKALVDRHAGVTSKIVKDILERLHKS
jgi:3-deoxy-D-manno-octulosonic-acid transferase